MAVTITALDKTPTRLRLQIANPSGNTIGSLVRVDANGTHTVRAESGVFPSTAVSLVVSDYEYPLLFGATITYTAYSPASAALGTLVIDAAHPLFNTGRGLVHLTVPQRPASGVQLNNGVGAAGGVLVSWDDTRPTMSTVHTVIGRADPVVVLRAAASRTGNMTFVCPDLVTAQAVQRTLAQALVFALRQSDQRSLDVYFVATSVALTHADADWTQDGPNTEQPERRWSVAVGFAEVAWPTGYVVPITVWTWNDVVAGYGDWNAVTGTFKTWANLLDRVPG